MKTITILLTAALVLAGTASADDSQKQAGAKKDVTVEFFEPENFTDFVLHAHGDKSGQQALQKEFRREIERVAERYLPPEHQLHLRFRDINMAGEFEPQAGPEFSDVRFMRAIYPPVLLVEYDITGASGVSVASGQRRISDLNYQNIVRYRTDDRLFYETELVTDLLREITRSL